MAKMKAGLKDTQPQRLFCSVTLSGANVATAEKLPFSVTIQGPQRQAVEIIDIYCHLYTSIQYQDLIDGYGQFKASLNMAENTAITPSFGEWSTLGLLWVNYPAVSASAEKNEMVDEWPKRMHLPPKDLEGRGCILPPDNLWIELSSSGCAAAIRAEFCVYYRVWDIDTNMALEMLQLINALQ